MAVSTSSNSVTITASHALLSVNPASWQSLGPTLPLGPLDHFVSTSVPVQVVFVYRAPPSSSSEPARSDEETPQKEHSQVGPEIIPIKRLTRALERTLDYYPHLTGRLSIDPANGERSVTQLGTGALLLEAHCSHRLDEFASPALPDGISLQRMPGAGNALLAPFDPNLEAVCRDPLFAVQHTRFACGGVALGVKVHHILTDADGFFQLMRDVADIYRQLFLSDLEGKQAAELPSLARPPHFRSHMCDLMGGNMSREQRKAALAFKPSLFYMESETAGEEVSKDIDTEPPKPLPPVTGRFIRYTAQELATIKARATAPDSESSGAWVSTFDALSAHIYQCTHPARVQLWAQDPSVGPISPTEFLTSINLRPRFPSAFPPHYFPQALLSPAVFIPPETLCTGPLWEVAKYTHEMMRSLATTSPEEIEATMRWICAQPDKRKIRMNFNYGSGSFMISQWNKTDMYGAVFETRPALVSPPFTPISLVDGLAYPLPTEDQGTERDTGAIDVAIALSDPLWDILREQGNIGGTIID